MIINQTPIARSTDPITSFMAADRVKEFKTAQHTKIMLALLTLGKAGAEQIGDLCDLDAYQTRKRLPELQRAGMAQPTQRHARRPQDGLSGCGGAV